MFYRGEKVKLSVIIPVYNERETIREVISRVSAAPFEKEIIVVDDGSGDGTREILKEFGNGVTLIFHERNKGKGASIRSALREVTGDVVIIQDADLEYDPGEFAMLIEPILSGETDVVYGSRNLARDKKGKHGNPVSSLPFYWGGIFLSKLTNLLYGVRITDESTGYKVFRTAVIKNLDLKCSGFEFCPEVTAKLCRKGYRIKEVPISYYPRGFEQGKKIGWRDGWIAVFVLLKYRFKQ